MVDPITGGFIDWACGKLADNVLSHLRGDNDLSRQVDKVIAKWAKSLPKERYVHPNALFPHVDPSSVAAERPAYCALQASLIKPELPKKQVWHAAFVESWRWIRDNVEEPQTFFLLAETEASKDLEQLVELTYAVCVQHEPIFKQAVIDTLDDIDVKVDGLDNKLDGIGEYLRQVSKVTRKPPDVVKVSWPGVSLPLGGPKVSVPFAGRDEELEALGKAMGGDKTVVAVVGMAGQGKSCLVGEWYKRGASPPKGVGLFWRKVYESGYTFDRFLDDLYLYLTGEEIDRQRFSSTESKAVLVEAALGARPCWIVLDGVERWLKRWVAEPDAGAEDLTADDRAGQDGVLDKFLSGASFWENGSHLLLTTRAVPSALDQSPPLMIGQEHECGRRLEDLKPDEAAELLKELRVRGEQGVIEQAAAAYGNHPYAVHVLGVLIRERYGGDASRWKQVKPLKEKSKGRDVGGLFERIIEHQREDLGLLELIACSVGPAPVQLLTERLQQEEAEIRRKLADLARWQMVEYDGADAGQHTVVRKFLVERMGREKVRQIQKAIAAWWAEQEVPARPDNIEQIRPLLKAVEHLLASGDPDAATDIFFTKQSAESDYTLSEWLRVFGYLEENIRLHSEVIRVSLEAIEKEGRRELRKDLALCYNNRGNALANQGNLSEAIADFSRAVKIYEELVEKEGRRELRNDIAMCYANRGNALQVQGQLSEAIADYGRAIEIREQLVEKEERRELRSDLAMCYNSRGAALRAQGKLSEAIADYARAIAIIEQLVEKEGRRELRNDLAMCYNNRGAALEDQGKLSEAIADFDRAIEIREQLVEKEGRRELRNNLAMCYNNRGNALRDQGKLSEAIADFGRAIEITEQLVEKEERRELRNDLASCYNNRGTALRDQGKLCEAIADFGRAIEIREQLVEKEERRELRNDLAMCYNNRGLALRDQGKLPEAIADYGRAIEIREQLVEKEERRELRTALGSSFFNRALAQSEMKEWKKACADIDKGGTMLQELVREGQRHVLGSFLRTAGFRCVYAQELGNTERAAQWANEAMRWSIEEVRAGRSNEMLLKASGQFLALVQGNLKLLLKNGLSKELWETFQMTLKTT